MSIKRKKSYIIQVIPTDGGATKSVVLSGVVAKISLFFLLSGFIVFGILIFHTVHVKEQLELNEKIASNNVNLIRENSEYKEALAILDSVKKIQKNISNLTEAFLDDNPDQNTTDEFETLDSLNNADIDNYVKKIQTRLQKVKLTSDKRPSIKPVIGIISRKFGQKIPEDGTTHKGLDIATMLNDPIYATAPGIVTYSGSKPDLGITIIIDHGAKTQTLYGHLNRSSVKVGDVVKRGQTIGVVGMTGNSTGPHLHYEVINDNINQNPEDFFY